MRTQTPAPMFGEDYHLSLPLSGMLSLEKQFCSEPGNSGPWVTLISGLENSSIEVAQAVVKAGLRNGDGNPVEVPLEEWPEPLTPICHAAMDAISQVVHGKDYRALLLELLEQSQQIDAENKEGAA